MSTPKDDRIYRFRGTSALLEQYRELDEQYIYFAPRHELNDQLEGVKDVYWRGDNIAWTQFFHHYLLCLLRCVRIGAVHGMSYSLTAADIPVWLTDSDLLTVERTQFGELCRTFFAHPEIARLPELLADSSPGAKRLELFSLLQLLHFRALRLACEIVSPDTPLCPPDAQLRTLTDPPFRLVRWFSERAVLFQKRPDAADALETLTLLGYSAFLQTALALDYKIAAADGGVWKALVRDFLDWYLDRLNELMYPRWYAACFVKSATNAAMWGHYGDGHRGVCLIFRTTATPSGSQALTLRVNVGISGTGDGIQPIIRDSPLELRPIVYSAKFPEIDFFRSLGRLTPPKLAFWFKGSDGSMSTTRPEDTEEWRQRYWQDFDNAALTKLSDWRYEEEQRIIIRSEVTDYSQPCNRRLAYRFSDLTGLIFGIHTPVDRKLAIIRIIEAKCRAAGRADFEFHQAVYSRRSGQIETVPLSLLKFKQDQSPVTTPRPPTSP